MRRRQLFEFMDLPQLPELLRDNLTDQLRAAEHLFAIFGVAEDLIAELLPLAGAPRVVDLCSGGGGPVLDLAPGLLQRGVAEEVVLTDLFPNQGAFAAAAARPGVRAISTPVDATAVPQDLLGVRTCFNAFHHLPPPVARAVLADAAARGQPILIVEALSRTLRGLVIAEGVALLAPLLALLTPPRRLDRVLLNTLVPIIPLMLLWEGAVSAQRCYTPDELKEMTVGLESAGYRWELGRRAVGPALTELNWLIGRPLKEGPQQPGTSGD